MLTISESLFNSKQLKVDVVRINENAVLPTYSHSTDAGADIYASESRVIFPGQTVIIPTGLSVAIPDGFYISIVPRSGLSAKTNLRLANSPGTIDSSYRGELGVILTNISKLELCDPATVALTKNLFDIPVETYDQYFELVRSYSSGDFNLHELVKVGNINDKHYHGIIEVRRGERIAQMIAKELISIKWNSVDELPESDRGAGGFGSTGTE